MYRIGFHVFKLYINGIITEGYICAACCFSINIMFTWFIHLDIYSSGLILCWNFYYLRTSQFIYSFLLIDNRDSFSQFFSYKPLLWTFPNLTLHINGKMWPIVPSITPALHSQSHTFPCAPHPCPLLGFCDSLLSPSSKESLGFLNWFGIYYLNFALRNFLFALHHQTGSGGTFPSVPSPPWLLSDSKG